MGAPGIAEYAQAFRDRIGALRRPDREVLDGPGIHGLLGRDASSLDGRVLVTDDAATDQLAARLPDLFARVVYVFDGAEASRQLLTRTSGYRAKRCTAMVRRDLATLPDLPLPAGLQLRAVDVTAGEDAGVPIEDAAAAALRSDASASPIGDLDGFVEYLRDIPRARFVAAVDDGGVVRATAATATWGTSAGVFFVNTDPAWRGRGAGTAMTAAALASAAAGGAERACLDASSLGLPIYLRLGFEAIGGLTQFVWEG